METEYLKRCFGNCLAQALAEVAKIQPSDPIEYLAHWLYHYRKTAKAKEKERQEKIQLQQEYDNSLEETKMAEMLKQEEYEIQQKYERCHQADSSTQRLLKALLTSDNNTSQIHLLLSCTQEGIFSFLKRPVSDLVSGKQY
ncbi:DPY30 domain-containing protein 2 isoform X2 [Vicugna pacos]